jgi:hypothetical protein
MSLFKDLTNEQFLSGLMLGAVFTLLTVLGIDKMFNKNVPMYTTVSAIHWKPTPPMPSLKLPVRHCGLGNKENSNESLHNQRAC